MNGRRFLSSQAWTRVKRVAKLLDDERKAKAEEILNGYRGDLLSLFRMVAEATVSGQHVSPGLSESKAQLMNKIKGYVKQAPRN